MPFTITPRVEKSVNTAHAMALGAEQHEADEPDSQMATGADKPLRSDDDAAKGVRNHPDSGRFMGTGETAYGASGAPIVDALARHQAPRPLASLATTPAVSLGSSIAPGEVTVTQLDYRQGIAPVMVNPSPVRPDFHQAPNAPNA